MDKMLPVKEAESYKGEIRSYPGKELWFESKAFGGHMTPYQIVAGNGDDTFDIDAFINSEMGELTINRVKYELAIVGNHNWNAPEMVEFWAKRGVVQKAFNTGDAPNEWLAFAPESALRAGNAEKYPLILCFHGGGGTLFESENHGFVHNCVEDKSIVVCPEAQATNTLHTASFLPAFIDEIEDQGYPIDRTRVYLTGMSMGGVASIYAGLANSGIVAGIAAHSCANVFDPSFSFEKLTDEMYAASHRLPMYLAIGGCDFKMLPFTQATIDGLNRWLEMNRCGHITADTSNHLGITADEVSTKQIDGTQYTLADYHDPDGVKMVQIVGIENQPHWVSHSYARLARQLLSKFSRVDGNLVAEP